MNEYLLLPTTIRLLTFAILTFSSTIILISSFYYILSKEKPLFITYLMLIFISLFIMLCTRTPLYGEQNNLVAEILNNIMFIPLVMSLLFLVSKKKIIYLFDFIFFIVNIIYLANIPYFNYVMAYSSIYALIRSLLLLFDVINKNKEKRGILCIKDALDNLDNGIILFNRFERTIYINKSMIDELKLIGIESFSPRVIQDYLISNANKIDDYTYIQKIGNKYYKFAINNPLTQISTFDVTELVELINSEKQTNLSLNNKNKELNDNLEMINVIQEEKDRLELKSQIHDNLAQELSILHMSLLTKNLKNLKELKKNLSSIKIAEVKNRLSIDELVETYKNVDVNIIVNGKMPQDERVSLLFYDAIRECTTNAIKHCYAKEIFVTITKENEKNVIVINNQGNTPKNVVYGNGLNGLLHKVNELNGSMNVDTSNGFTVKIIV